MSTSTSCLHCGQEIVVQNNPTEKDGLAASAEFCCGGCEAAHSLIQGLGLDQYYARRCIDPDARPIRPDEEALRTDFTAHVKTAPDGSANLHLMVDGLQCAACVWLIETVLRRQPGVRHARLNMTTRRLALTWDPALTDANAVTGAVIQLGYRLMPFDPERLNAAEARTERDLLKAL